VTQVCPAFVTLVEKGELDTPATYSTAETYLRPLLDAGVDQIVLGCTHFAYLAPVIREIVGDGVGIIDPSPAVARQTGRVIAKMSNEEGHGGRTTYMTSGSVEAFIALAEGMVDGFQPAEAQVVGLRWEGDSLTMPEETKPWHIR
jgi:glutamate racemase